MQECDVGGRCQQGTPLLREFVAQPAELSFLFQEWLARGKPFFV
ncbi:MAG TPA: hypothetical protein VJT08_04195 [Terriglobales bacterium]|nr:hypothetical protein [Terriglobales bacterium]